MKEQVDIWIVPLNPSEETAKRCWATLSEAEQVRAGRFLRDRDRRRFVVAHGAMREILGAYCETSAADLHFETNEYGKPHLGANPRIEFNLSHSGDLALVAVAPKGCRVGVDVEEVRRDVSEGVAERFFSAGELRQLRRVGGDEQVNGFFRCWTRKEAYLKALGRGISDQDLAAVEVTLLKEELPEILQRAGDDGTEKWTVFHLEPCPGFIGAVVVERMVSDLRIKTWPEDDLRTSI